MSEIIFFLKKKKVIALGRSPWCENQADMEVGDKSVLNKQFACRECSKWNEN